MGQVIELLKSINYQVSKELLFNYKKINITDRQLIILIYLINQHTNLYNPKQISTDLNIDFKNTLIVAEINEKDYYNRPGLVKEIEYLKYLSDEIQLLEV